MEAAIELPALCCRASGTMAKPSLIEHSPRSSRDKKRDNKRDGLGMTAMAASMHSSRERFCDKNQEKRRAYLSAFS